MGWQNRQDSRVLDAEPQAEFPWAQWVNRGSDLDPRQQIGGFFVTSINLSALGDPELEGAVASTLTVGGGSDFETGLYLPGLEVSVLGSRFAWQTKVGGRSRLGNEYEPGARGKLQVLVLVKTAGDTGWSGPLMLTVTGTVSKDLNEAIKAHRQAVRQATGGQGATAWFWMTLAAGTPERRGSGNATSMVTPMFYRQQEDLIPDEVYIGDDAADFVEELFDQVQTWEGAWGQQEEQSGEPDAYTEPEPQQRQPQEARVDAQGRPAGLGSMADARHAWSDQWNALKKLGLTAPFLDNSWSVEQIEAATRLMGKAGEKIEGGTPIDVAAAELIAALEKV